MSIQACAEITRKGDPDRFLATMAAPPEARELLFPLYAMNVEVSRAPWVTQEPLIAQMRLQWWLDALDEISEARTVRSHEVTTPLSGVLSKDQARALKSNIEARNWDIQRDSFLSIDALFDHLDATAGTLAAAACQILGGPSEPARNLGFAQGAAAWLKAVPNLMQANRKPLPGEPLAAVESVAKEGLRRWMVSRVAEVAKPARPALLVGFDAPLILQQALRNPERALTGDLGVSEFRRRLRLLTLSAFSQW